MPARRPRRTAAAATALALSYGLVAVSCAHAVWAKDWSPWWLAGTGAAGLRAVDTARLALRWLRHTRHDTTTTTARAMRATTATPKGTPHS